MKKLTLLNLIFGLILIGCKDDPSIIGTWKLIADQEVDSLGNIVNQDTNVSGQLIYTPDGDMNVQLLWHQERKPIMSDTIMNYDGKSTGLGLGNNSWTSEQNSILIDTYDAYFGEYELDWDNRIVTHRINGNLRPEKNLKEYKRKFILKGDTLFLRSTDPREKWQVLWVRKNN